MKDSNGDWAHNGLKDSAHVRTIAVRWPPGSFTRAGSNAPSLPVCPTLADTPLALNASSVPQTERPGAGELCA